MIKRYIWLSVGVSLIVIGLILGLPSILQNRQESNVPKVSAAAFTEASKVAAPQPNTPAYIEGTPVRLQIPSLGIDLPVISGYYNKATQKWTLTKDKVQYATITPLPNNARGNTFLYGHNRHEVFKNLSKIGLGAEAIITTSNGHTFTYTFRGALETTPTDDSLFHYQGAPILTVQTCSGAFYQNRQLFTFDLKVAR